MSAPNYNRADQDEAHYVNLAGDEYIGFVSKQLACELIDELTAAQQDSRRLEWLMQRFPGPDAITRAEIDDAMREGGEG